MHFCVKCKNMYYVKIEEHEVNQLVYYCRSCGDVNVDLALQNTCVSKIYTSAQTDDSFGHLINAYTKNDPTLPRTTGVACPNVDCTHDGKKGEPLEVIIIRYDNTNLKYMYMCSECDHVWTYN